MMGLTSMAVSIDSYQTREFETAARIVSTLVDLLIKSPLPSGASLNVNIPDRPWPEIKGIRLVKQGTFRSRERFERRIDPRENVYYWQAGILPPPEIRGYRSCPLIGRVCYPDPDQFRPDPLPFPEQTDFSGKMSLGNKRNPS